MLKPKDDQAKAAECRKLAEQATSPEARARWLSMEQFWLNQIEGNKITPDSKAEIAKP